VQPPDKTGVRAKTFIYPSEFLKLVSCPDVPRGWRELCAVACYLYLRPGELRALVWTDIDVVHVTKAYDEDSKTVKTRRRGTVYAMSQYQRRLLKAMRGGAGQDADPVLPLMQELNENRRAGWMRKHLKLAGIDRARLTEETATTM
jgi:integrase